MMKNKVFHILEFQKNLNLKLLIVIISYIHLVVQMLSGMMVLKISHQLNNGTDQEQITKDLLCL